MVTSITLVVKRDNVLLFVSNGNSWGFPCDTVDLSLPLADMCDMVAGKFGISICKESISSIDIDGSAFAFTCNWKSGELSNGIWADPDILIPKPVDVFCGRVLDVILTN